MASAAGNGAQLGSRHTGIRVDRLNPEGKGQGKDRQTCSHARHCFRALPVRSRRRNRGSLIEQMLDNYGVSEANWRDGSAGRSFSHPRLVYPPAVVP